jgi:hypothetical protein
MLGAPYIQTSTPDLGAGTMHLTPSSFHFGTHRVHLSPATAKPHVLTLRRAGHVAYPVHRDVLADVPRSVVPSTLSPLRAGGR